MPEIAAQSALVIAVPEAEPVVGDQRALLDSAAALGVPAHVTVLFPFVAADDLDDDVLRRIADAIRPVPTCGYRFARTARFDDRVLYLATDDDAPFRELTDRVHAEFPGFPPFGCVFADVVPHLTVGQGRPREVLAAADCAIDPRLPVQGRATAILLLAQDEPGGRWRRRSSVPLSPQ